MSGAAGVIGGSKFRSLAVLGYIVLLNGEEIV